MSDAYMMERRIVLMEMMTTVMEKRMSDGDSSTSFCEEQRSDQSTAANPLLLAILTPIQTIILHMCVFREEKKYQTNALSYIQHFGQTYEHVNSWPVQ